MATQLCVSYKSESNHWNHSVRRHFVSFLPDNSKDSIKGDLTRGYILNELSLESSI